MLVHLTEIKKDDFYIASNILFYGNFAYKSIYE